MSGFGRSFGDMCRKRCLLMRSLLWRIIREFVLFLVILYV